MARRYVQDLPGKCHIQDENIVAGIKLWMTCLNTGEELKSGGSDKEIAQVLHNAYVTQNTSLAGDACTVLVFINNRVIKVYDHVTNETLYTFRLMDVKDVTRGLDRYNKFLVLVAKEYEETSFKAYIFYSKASPACFYNITRRAFQLGHEALKRNYVDFKKEIAQCLENINLERHQTNTYHGLCCVETDHSDLEDEFEWSTNATEQTCLLHPCDNVAEFRHNNIAKRKVSFVRKKSCRLC